MSAEVVYLRPRGADTVHAVPSGEPAAVCGRRPVRGWVEWRCEIVTCPKCRAKLGMGPVIPPRAER